MHLACAIEGMMRMAREDEEGGSWNIWRNSIDQNSMTDILGVITGRRIT